MFQDEVIQHYPIPSYHKRQKNENFLSYGTCGAVNIEIDEVPADSTRTVKSEQHYDDPSNLTKRTKFVCQIIRDRSHGRYELVAKNPSEPLTPPNQCEYRKPVYAKCFVKT